MIVKLLTEHHLEFLSLKEDQRRLQRLIRVYTCQNATLYEISCTGSIINFNQGHWSMKSRSWSPCHSPCSKSMPKTITVNLEFFFENFIFANSILRHICDAKNS